MIGIGRHTDYASRIVLHLAALDADDLAPIPAIAARRLLPQPFVRRIVGRLVAAGIVETVRGARGGIRLARPAAEISLLDVLRAVEGGVVLNPCVDTPLACPLSPTCPVREEWTRITRGLEVDLAGVSFSTLAGRLADPIAGAGRPSRETPRARKRSVRRARSKA